MRPRHRRLVRAGVAAPQLYCPIGVRPPGRAPAGAAEAASSSRDLARPAKTRGFRRSCGQPRNTAARHPNHRELMNKLFRDVEGGPLCPHRSEEHTSGLQSLMRNSYAVFCLKKKIKNEKNTIMRSRQLP